MLDVLILSTAIPFIFMLSFTIYGVAKMALLDCMIMKGMHVILNQSFVSGDFDLFNKQ